MSWRLLGTDPDHVAFNLYRVTGGGAPVKLNAQPIVKATCYQDGGADPGKEHAYFVRPVTGGKEGERSRPFLGRIAANAPFKPYFEIPLKLPPKTSAGDGSLGDLDGDGEYEIVIKGCQQPRDTASTGLTGNTVLQAYRLDGSLLWTIGMGRNIREGEHDTQFMVYDLDGDGRAEVAVRTADGTVDGKGKVIGSPDADWRDTDPASRTFGRIMKGPEHFTIFDGLTGAALATVDYVPGREPIDGWGGIGGNCGTDTVGNRCNRFLACIAYLDGVRPSVVMCRGVYGRTVLAAWDWRGGRLTRRWVFDSATHPNGGQPYVTPDATVDAKGGLNRITDNAGSWDGVSPGQWLIWDREGVKQRRKVLSVRGRVITVDESMTAGANRGCHVYGYSGMGGHSVSVADIDRDGRDEIVYCSMAVDDDGKGIYTTGLRHGDALHVGDLDPGRPGLEVFGPHENEGCDWDRWTPGAALYEALTGKVLWATTLGEDGTAGLTGDIDPRHPGEEMWSVPGGLFTCRGERIAARGPAMSNFAIWWDGDPLREMIGGNRITKWDWEKGALKDILVAQGSAAAAATKSSPVVSADFLGDWREEAVFRTPDNSALRIYTTTDPTETRIHTLMHDPQYRLSVAWQNVVYNQPPHPGFFLGHGMAVPPRPNIIPVRAKPAR